MYGRVLVGGMVVGLPADVVVGSSRCRRPLLQVRYRTWVRWLLSGLSVVFSKHNKPSWGDDSDLDIRGDDNKGESGYDKYTIVIVGLK